MGKILRKSQVSVVETVGYNEASGQKEVRFEISARSPREIELERMVAEMQREEQNAEERTTRAIEFWFFILVIIFLSCWWMESILDDLEQLNEPLVEPVDSTASSPGSTQVQHEMDRAKGNPVGSGKKTAATTAKTAAAAAKTAAVA